MSTAIKNARIFDGKRILEPRTIVIENGIISKSKEAEEVIDGAGCTLLPGLIDSHAHLYEDTKYLKMAAGYGVTTLLDMGIRRPEAVKDLRSIPGGASVFSSCGMIFAPGSKGPEMMKYPRKMAAEDAKYAAGLVDEAVRQGADFIKLILEEKGRQNGVDFPLDVGRAVVEQAHKHNKKVISHAVTNKTYQRGLDIGVDVLTHIPFTSPLEESLAEAVVSSGTVVVPTLIMGECLIEKMLKEHPWAVKIKTAVDRIKKGSDAFDFRIDMARDSLSVLYRAGARILAGTDSNMDDPTTPAAVPYGKSLHRELAFFVDAGMSPVEALQSATSAPAEYFGLCDRGMLEPGLRADLLLVKGNPAVNIRDMGSVKRVWIQGNEVKL